MLAPRWSQVPFGTIMRRETDLRTYHNLFTGRSSDVTGWRRAYVRLRARRIAEPEALSDPPPRAGVLTLIVFEGFRGQFQRLHGWHDLIRQELLAMTRPEWREKAEAIPGPYIAAHVRLGDFRRPDARTDHADVDNMATPLSWFIESLKVVRARLGVSIPVVVTSDGRAHELRPILELENVRLASTGSAIGDLLLLSRAILLLASGSSFSAWASYLGRMPTLSYPGQSLARLFHLKGSAEQYVADVSPTDIPQACFNSISERILTTGLR
jgi:hypothetical protein